MNVPLRARSRRQHQSPKSRPPTSWAARSAGAPRCAPPAAADTPTKAAPRARPGSARSGAAASSGCPRGRRADPAAPRAAAARVPQLRVHPRHALLAQRPHLQQQLRRRERGEQRLLHGADAEHHAERRRRPALHPAQKPAAIADPAAAARPERGATRRAAGWRPRGARWSRWNLFVPCCSATQRWLSATFFAGLVMIDRRARLAIVHTADERHRAALCASISICCALTRVRRGLAGP